MVGRTIHACVRSLAICIYLSGAVSPPSFGQDVPPEPLRVVGSSTIQPVIAEIAKDYHDVSGVTLEILGGGSGAGIEALRAGTADVATVSRSLTADEREEFSWTTIGYDALAIIVNRENSRESIVTAELLDIYTGRIQIWDAAPQWAAEIVLVSKQVGRGTLAVFEEFTGLMSPARSDDGGEIISKRLISADAWEAGSNLDSILWVGGIPGAVGFVSIGAADEFIALGHPVRKLALDGVPADEESIESGAYPIVRELNLVYRGSDGTVLDLIRYISSEAGRAAVSAHGYIPAGSTAPSARSEESSR